MPPRSPKVSTSAAAAEAAFQEDYGQLFKSQSGNEFPTPAVIKSQMVVNRVVSPVDGTSQKDVIRAASPVDGPSRVFGAEPIVRGQSDSLSSSGSSLSSLDPSITSQDAEKTPSRSSEPPPEGASREVAHDVGQPMSTPPYSPTSQQTTSTASGASTAFSRSLNECRAIGDMLFDGKENGSDTDGVAREFDCCFCDKCTTGQYTLDVARKVVSDYFGRNKTPTRVIKKWLYSCRKHYQRSSYQPVWQTFKYAFIEAQLDLVDEQQPGVLWTIQFVLEERRRLDAEYQKAAVAGQAFNPNTAEYQRIDQEKPQELPIAVLHALQMFCGTNKTKEDCLHMLSEARDHLEKERCLHLAHFEFIPQWDPKLFKKWLEELKDEEKAKIEAKKDQPAKKNQPTKKKSCGTKRKSDESSGPDSDSEPPRKMPRRKAPAQVDNGEGSSRLRTRSAGANGKGGFRKA